jgi:hypothetical protein
MHERVFASLRDVFYFPVTFGSALRDEWRRFSEIYEEEKARYEIENPSYRAAREQRRIARQIGRSGNDLFTDLRRYWEAGKVRPRPPEPPANE